MHIFTITAGRTGTAWLAELVRVNLGIEAVHEHLGPDDFGTRMPDIRTMRQFAHHGCNDVVRAFWAAKLAGLRDLTGYAETNHTLAKCGLVETLAEEWTHPVTFILLRRDWTELALSFLRRGAFRNMTLIWQWYLDPNAPGRIIDPVTFRGRDGMGVVLWYIAEVEARQQYYRSLFADRFRFVDTSLEILRSADGAASLLRALGHEGDVVLPERRNHSRGRIAEESRARVTAAVAGLDVDPRAEAARFIDAGLRLDRISARGGRAAMGHYT